MGIAFEEESSHHFKREVSGLSEALTEFNPDETPFRRTTFSYSAGPAFEGRISALNTTTLLKRARQTLGET
jgi:hypothetical protein